ncbi:PQQ-dependent dehydrogenase, methanol/ethanol family [Phenylobacterium sp. LjRoot225]|uniref:PQQ-dependent dehydrogenase, methanol/ethanol family n=1 Tax=Phenylobacterium sp. LjRoot225 TaxID=3342285 RepID=UPI003ECF5C06
MSFSGRALLFVLLAATFALGGYTDGAAGDEPSARGTDRSSGQDWAGYGRTFGQQHFSPLAQIHRGNTASLGLAWTMDLPLGNTVTQPIAVDGVLYFASGLSIVHAVDAVTGKELWQYDSKVGEVGGLNMRLGWGVRGVAWWNGRIYVGAQDGRLIALDARTGRPVWTTKTFKAEDPAYISGAPRVFDGKVLIGFAGTTGVMRGYVSAYDAETGKLLWRFWTVPGDPAKGFENKAMAFAAKTWSGEWWKFGGGGAVWNSIAYDADSGLVYIGVGSPYPWNHRVRSAGSGDNLFVDSIVALDLKTGEYRWHYQTTPGDTWDFDAAMDIELADLTIEGKPRKVLMQAPKNGFFYVIDRITGELISAEPFVRVTWATKVDKRTGRPVEAPGARYGLDKPARGVAPTALAAHNWMPMAYSRETGLVYIPSVDWAIEYSDPNRPWKDAGDRTVDGGVDMKGGALFGMPAPVGFLLAWSPVTQKEAWRFPYPSYYNGGVLATGGDLVFQGSIDGYFRAFSATTGALAWQFDAKAPILAPPISFEANGQQYVTVLTGLAMGYVMNSTALAGPAIERYGLDPQTQARRVLTFAIGGKASLPPRLVPPPPPEDPHFTPLPAKVTAGAVAYSAHCLNCHGALAVGIGHAPDLRRSALPLDQAAFEQVVRSGALEPRGMPGFAEFSDEKLEDIRHYLRSRAADLRRGAAFPLLGEAPATLDIK